MPDNRPPRSIDERIDAVTMNLELLSQDVQAQAGNIAKLIKAAKQDGENIRALARIAEIHEHRL